MIQRESFEALDLTLRDIYESNDIFSGIVTVSCGDFRQRYLVLKRGHDTEMENTCITKSYT